MPQKKFKDEFVREFEKELLNEIEVKKRDFDAWECFVLLIDKKNIDCEDAIRLWYELKLEIRKDLRKLFNEKYHSCSQWK